MGITLLNSLDNITLNEYIITKYITNLNLIKGKKYDLRLHVLITGLKPLRIYLSDEGFVRIASEKYIINERSAANKFIHLTNIYVNKKNKKYKIPNTTSDENANIYNLLLYKSFLEKYKINWNDIKEKIKDIIIKSIISLYRILIENIEKHNLSDQNSYNYLGYDILITDKLKPFLIEINDNPTMEIFNEMDKHNKYNLFVDTLNLVGITPYSKKSGEPYDDKFKFTSEFEDNINNAFCELERPRGNYELIFPDRKGIDIYKKYFIDNTEENIKFWQKIKSQQ